MTASSTRLRDSRIARLAARQAGAFSRAQALAIGFTDPSIGRRLRSGVWVRAHPGVYQPAGVPPMWVGEVWAAFLAVGPMATVTHETSLRVHGSDHVRPRPVILTVPHGGHPRVRGAFVHQIDDLRPAHVTTVDGLPVSTAARAVVEVAATLGSRQLGRVLDDLVFDKRTQYPEVAVRLAEVARPGKPGVAKLAAVLDERSDEAVPPGSELERAMFAALVGGGLPAPQPQVALPGVGPLQGLVDAAYPEAKLILEADGRRWHTRVRDLARDHARDCQAARAGWQTLRFAYEHINYDPEGVCATVADVLAVRLPRPATAGVGGRAAGGLAARTSIVRQ
ncbi:MAG TPA: type IV toxin-antitoxin system AbiEi family antitoxin domain-containing protein [Acidimicrobiales bacterium]